MSETLDAPLCLIPARGGSKRLKRKNVVMLAGKPLLAYAIEAAIKSDVFDTICVSSEDQEILEIADEYGADLLLERPARLATDSAQVIDVWLHTIEWLQKRGQKYTESAVMLTTNPLRTYDDIKTAYDVFCETEANFLMSLVPFHHPPQRAVSIGDRYVHPHFGHKYMKQTQRLETLYRHDGSFIFARTEALQEERTYYGTKIAPFVMPERHSVDIDEPIDLAWAEFLLSHYGDNG